MDLKYFFCIFVHIIMILENTYTYYKQDLWKSRFTEKICYTIFRRLVRWYNGPPQGSNCINQCIQSSMKEYLKWLRLFGSRIKAKCLHMGPVPTGEVVSFGVFLRDPILYIHKFGENHGKLRTIRLTSAMVIEISTSRLQFLRDWGGGELSKITYFQDAKFY